MMIFKACVEITVLEGGGHYLLRASSLHQVSHCGPITVLTILEQDVHPKHVDSKRFETKKKFVAGLKMLGLLLLPIMLVVGDVPCQQRDFGHSSHVCVCNRSPYLSVCLSVCQAVCLSFCLDATYMSACLLVVA